MIEHDYTAVAERVVKNDFAASVDTLLTRPKCYEANSTKRKQASN